MKQERKEEIKRELFYMKGEVLVLVGSPQVWKHPRAHTLGCPLHPRPPPPLKENTFVLKPPLHIVGFSS
jgi:hypothetical protein